MKPLTCDMCGSNDVIKQDGLFVCQICGTKYSVEEAKKMMIEGTVDVSGSTVKIDNSSSAKNFFMMAKSADEAKNYAETETYCNKVIEIEPKHYEAWYLKGKAAAWQSTLANQRLEESVQCFSKAIEYAPENQLEELKEHVSEEFLSFVLALVRMSCNSFVKHPISINTTMIISTTLNSQKSAIQLIKKCGVGPGSFTEEVAEVLEDTVDRAWPGIKAAYTGDDGHPNKYEFERFKTACFDCIKILNIAITIDKDNPECNVLRYRSLIKLTEQIVKACSWKKVYSNGKSYWAKDISLTKEAKEININNIMEYHQKIKEIDPNYEIPKRPKSGGCYVATCVYGSYDCPEVWTLRRYRDEKLAKTWYGKAFIHTYYTVSPTIVKLFGEKDWFRNLWRTKLDKMVADLQKQGVESSPYDDKSW